MTEATASKIKFPNRYDIVGSFLRTDELKAAREKFEAGEITQARLTAIQYEETKKIVDKQIALGLKAVTDGEFNRSWWHLDFLWGLNGVATYDYQESYKFHGSKTRTDNVKLVGKVAYNPDHPFFDSFKYLASITPDGITPKQTIPSPSMLFRDNRSDNWSEFYDAHEEYLTDLASAYHQTILRFYELGARYVQLDDTTWAFLISKLHETADTPTEHQKYLKIAQDSVKVINDLLADLPEDLTVTTHICRGNFKSTYLFSGGYDDVAEYLGQLNYDGVFLEYDDSRSGSFGPLAKIWHGDENKRIVLGLITSKKPELENQDDIIARVHEAAQFVPLENLALSTQCGFASTEEGNKLTQQEQWDKLKFVIQTAEKIWHD
ncbi:vitamin B12 independent methionine synthase [Weissella paramesenteroides]|uniref:vitamin B12 independent methionine synthase n=1 Tax=Weissella paramesenteroides TaxID=1249 RepID=UPI0020730269|nr:vitamin B12 independent methionine synthase [Weissella paramesenteroides]MCM6764666.1 vitamin B12 independent methionine synthase [Weissella paramesenteroides]MCM6768224.1 vitamin B12 independent methionine synthase [Weissella paramesenteroides]MCM6768530.1 vitamin B12 independent methionine synthase [Weissella paramesenteroides]MCM6770603.1 vitamin B12 independent methionine synthase [Weissella paramesenteroides]MCM6780526.1 vitamin B12 independent methionine synthase [Weissella paramesent